MIWRKVNKIKYKNLDTCIKDFFKKSYVLSDWIFDIVKRLANMSLINQKFTRYIELKFVSWVLISLQN